MHPDDRPQQLAEGFFLEGDRTQHIRPVEKVESTPVIKRRAGKRSFKDFCHNSISQAECTPNQVESIPPRPLVVTLEELIMSKGQ